VILLLAEILKRADVRCRLRLSSLGNAATRAAYNDELRAFLRSRESTLADEVRERIDTNPLRAFDADHPGTRATMVDAPRLIDQLDPDDAEHFEDVRALLDQAGCEYELDATLVRGLDYYTRTVFEFESPDLGAQSGVGGGGRYDGLVEQLGGPPTPGVGWAAGIERILLAGTGVAAAAAPVFIAIAKPERSRDAFALAHALWMKGKHAQLEQAGRSMKGQIKHADRVNADWTVVLGDTVEVKDMGTGEQREVPGLDEAIEAVTE
jgi:histidyl-tRNA synthetase